MTRNHLRQLIRSVRTVCWDYSSSCWLDLSEQSSIVVRGADGKLLKLGGQFGEVGVVLAMNGSVDVVRDRAPTLVHITWPGDDHFSRQDGHNDDLLLLDLSELWRPNSENLTPVKSPELSPLLPFLWLKFPVLDWKYPANLTSETSNEKIIFDCSQVLPADIGTARPTVGAEPDVLRLRLVIILNVNHSVRGKETRWTELPG